MSTIGAFPATFDPVTYGHVALIERSALLFDRLYVGVYVHAGSGGKQPLFTAEERVELVREATRDVRAVQVVPFEGLAVDFALSIGAQVIVRGLRVADDFELERQMAMMNKHLAPEIETILLISAPSHAFVSSSLVREVALMGGDVSELVPPAAATALTERRRRNMAGTD